MRINREVVRSALTIPELMEHYGYEGRLSGGSHRFNSCPACGDGTDGKFCAQAETCYCHACGFTGDVFGVLGAILDLDVDVHFVKILTEAAAIAGVEGEEAADFAIQKREQRCVLQEEQDRRRALEYERAELGAGQVWQQLATESGDGLRYLLQRGIRSADVRALCRFTSHSVCLPLWRDGRVVNVVGRRFDTRHPKIRGLDRCRTRGSFGRPFLNHGHHGPVVIVEGFFDYLSALEISPSRLVLGAHGCANLGYVAEVAARLVVGTGRSIVLVGHEDEAGRSAMAAATKSAIAAGLPEDAINEYQVGSGCNDLNDQLLRRAKAAANA